MNEIDAIAAGQLLGISVQHDDPVVRRFAEVAAKMVAEHGVVAARGWLLGIWYVGGVNPVDSSGATSYHAVIRVLQIPLGITIVKGRLGDA